VKYRGEIVNLADLRELNLHKNGISGIIHQALENLKQLVVLSFNIN
jgi:hypothetical protein